MDTMIHGVSGIQYSQKQRDYQRGNRSKNIMNPSTAVAYTRGSFGCSTPPPPLLTVFPIEVPIY